MDVLERIGSMAGTDTAKAANLAHQTFQTRIAETGHTGKALLHTLAELCEQHPNIVGLGVGLLVDQFLVHERRAREAHEKLEAEAIAAGHALAKPGAKAGQSGPKYMAPYKAAKVRAPKHMAHIKPGKIAFEVFGAILALKFATAMGHIMRRKTHKESWVAHIAHIRLLSSSIAAYYLAKSIKQHEVSAWRNAAIALFATDAIKPILKVNKKLAAEGAKRAAAERRTAALATVGGPEMVATAPAVTHGDGKGGERRSVGHDDGGHGAPVH